MRKVFTIVLEFKEEIHSLSVMKLTGLQMPDENFRNVHFSQTVGKTTGDFLKKKQLSGPLGVI